VRNAVRLSVGILLVCSTLGCGSDTRGRGDGAAGVAAPSTGGVKANATGGSGGTDAGMPSGSGGMVAAGGGGSAASGAPGSGGMGGVAGGSPAKLPFDAGTDPNRNAVTAGTICDRLATIQCAGEAACCNNPGRDVATCKASLLMACTSQLMVDAIAQQPAAAFDAAQAQSVFTQLETLSAACDPGVAAFGVAPSGLRSIFRGTIAPGGDCTPPNLLDKASAGGMLAACTMGDGYACLPSLLKWNCSAHAAAGGRCFSDINCNDGLFCDNPNLAINGSTCMTRKAVGAACKQGNECQTLFCRGSVCVASDAQAAYCLK